MWMITYNDPRGLLISDLAETVHELTTAMSALSRKKIEYSVTKQKGEEKTTPSVGV